MRDPNRIEPLLKAMKELWILVPDWRLGQLVSNLARATNVNDPFFVEDDKMMEAISLMKAALTSGDCDRLAQ